jgi:hypothetical protein
MNKNFKVYRPNMSEHYVIVGTHMTVNESGNAQIFNDNTLVAVIPKNLPVIVEQ